MTEKTPDRVNDGTFGRWLPVVRVMVGVFLALELVLYFIGVGWVSIVHVLVDAEGACYKTVWKYPAEWKFGLSFGFLGLAVLAGVFGALHWYSVGRFASTCDQCQFVS